MPVKTSLKNIAIVAHGQFDESLKAKIEHCDHVIAVDGGLIYLDKLGIKPDPIIGDLDSLTDGILNRYPNIPVKKFLKDKDETDLELAITHAAALNPDKIYLFAATGKRIDHTVTNLILLSKYPGLVISESAEETIFAIKEEVTLKTKPGQTISLLPLFGKAESVTTHGLNWELNNSTMSPDFYSQSNFALGDEVRVSVGKGTLLCFIIQ